MSESNGKSKKATTKAANMESLTQQEASWLIGKPTSWLRDRADLDGRRPDGGYNARDLVRAFLAEERTKVAPVNVPEMSLHVLDRALYFDLEPRHEHLVVQTIRELRDEYGPAGLAAVGQLLLTVFEQEIQRRSAEGQIDRRQSKRSVAELRQEVEEEAEMRLAVRIKQEDERDRRERALVVSRCYDCGSIRWAGEWRKMAVPKSFIVEGDLQCDRCHANESQIKNLDRLA